MKRKPRSSVLDGSTDPTAPPYKRMSADALLSAIAAASYDDSKKLVYQNELVVRQITASEAAAAESADTGRKLVVLTYVLVVLTLVLVALTIVLLTKPGTDSTTTRVLVPASACTSGRDPLGNCYDPNGLTGPKPPSGGRYDKAWYCAHPVGAENSSGPVTCGFARAAAMP